MARSWCTAPRGAFLHDIVLGVAKYAMLIASGVFSFFQHFAIADYERAEGVKPLFSGGYGELIAAVYILLIII